jgi:hypothetical protein
MTTMLMHVIEKSIEREKMFEDGGGEDQFTR